MKKIIAIFIITAVLVNAPFKNVNGQDDIYPTNRITSTDFPIVNVRIGANAKLSTRLWRFEPFLQHGVSIQLFQEKLTSGYVPEVIDDRDRHHNFYSQRFVALEILGVDFRITDNDRIKFKFGGWFGFGEEFMYLGYVRTQNLSQKTSFDLYGLHTIDKVREGWNLLNYSAAIIGGRFDYEIIRNLKLGVQLEYRRMYNVNTTFFESIENISGSTLNRNLIDFSVGLHYRIGYKSSTIEPHQKNQRIQSQPKRSNVRTTQSHRQINVPCPAHRQRSWERPTSVFNRVGN